MDLTQCSSSTLIFNISGTTHNPDQDEIKELRNVEDINVWGLKQEDLEQQALKEIEEFAEHRYNETQQNIEDGEILDNVNEPRRRIAKQNLFSPLNVSSFIERQEELRKSRDYTKHLAISKKSRQISNEISKKQNETCKLKCKRKRSTKTSDNGKICKITKETNDVKQTKMLKSKNNSDSDYVPSDEDSSDSDYKAKLPTSCKTTERVKCKEKAKDDGDIDCYKYRLKQYYEKLENEKSIFHIQTTTEDEDVDKDGLKIPYCIWSNLYSYQQDGVEWLWQLHQSCKGGLLGDEMGLGKTVQIIAFLHALNYSRIISKHGRYTGLGPTLIVCPATVLHQWVQHFHEWSPEFRVVVLHQSGSYIGNKITLIREVNKEKAILVTTYLAVLKYKGMLAELDWHYVILDEGHKIRNPAAKVSMAVKAIHTPHRIVLTGSPMQNNLQELWSLFDFINPGMLGELPTFLDHFANPIIQGGYMNATPMQEATALSVATALKDLISPYLLRRIKNDVKKLLALPKKSEQVLFCALTDEQRDLYKGYLMSEFVSMIVGRGGKNWFSQNQTRANILVAITTLRKICNHPDLYLGEFDENSHIHNLNDATSTEEKFGYYKRGGKMVVVSALLKIWKKQGHRVLLFTQSRAMILVFEVFLQQQGYKYLKMDGSTSVSSRQPLISKFNEDSSYDIFLLTTRVGGLGINLTGANRVIIYDPDWNPATDIQARERAWRIGQSKQVTVYRLLSAGTIEEKMYQRQVWKQLLSNKVLLDPTTQKFFRSSDLHDLFSLQEKNDTNPETANIFHNSRVKLEQKLSKKHKSKSKQKQQTEITTSVQFSEDKIQAMKTLAQQIAKSMSAANAVPNDKPVKKTSYQIELERERQEKLKEREDLKILDPMELRLLNRKKLEKPDDSNINKIDDLDTNASFSKALEITEKTAALYHNLNSTKSGEEVLKYTSLLNEVTAGSSDEKCDSKNTSKKQKIKVKDECSVKVDRTGLVDGEVVEGLIKKEVKKTTHFKASQKRTSQDDYVLEKLFSKKGVCTALQHDKVIHTEHNKQNNVKIHYEAQMKADLALQAIRKSRLHKWRW